MKTVKEVSTLTGVSIRTLHYYDSIGLLHPSVTTDAGYRLYDDANLERLQSILLFRELEFPLKDIIRILNSSDFDREKALTQQIELLEMKKKRLEDLICFAREIKTLGVNKMDFKVFDTSKIDAYAAQAKASWGGTDAYKEFEKKSAAYSEEQKKTLTMPEAAALLNLRQKRLPSTVSRQTDNAFSKISPPFGFLQQSWLYQRIGPIINQMLCNNDFFNFAVKLLLKAPDIRII